MSQHSVFICVPTYEPDHAQLTQALDSVLAQTHTDFTVLIHDDASHANVHAIVEPYLEDPRFRFARSAVRLGIGGNWNACLKQAEGPFVQFLFQDDTWHPDYLASALEAFDIEPTVGLVAVNHHYALEGDVSFTDAQAPLFRGLAAERQRMLQPGRHDGGAFLSWWMERGLHPNVIGEPSFVMLKRELIESVGVFNPSMAQMLDVEYWVRCLLKQDWFYVQKDLGMFRVHANAASARNFDTSYGMFDRLQCYQYMLKELPSPLRRKALHSMEDQLAGMIRKFFERKKTVGAVARGGMGKLATFCVSHPITVLKAMRRYMVSA